MADMNYPCSTCAFCDVAGDSDPCCVCMNGQGDDDDALYWKPKHPELFSEDLSITENEKGGKQSKIPGRYDLLPPIAIGEMAGVLEHGADKFGEWNWLNITALSHLNHAIRHLFAYLCTKNFEDLTHAGVRVMFAIHQHYEEHKDV